MRFLIWVLLFVTLLGCEKRTSFYTHIVCGRLMNVADPIASDDVACPVFVEEWNVGRPRVGYLTGYEECHSGTLSELIGVFREKELSSEDQRHESFTSARRLISRNGLEYLLIETEYDCQRNFHPRRFLAYSLEGGMYTLVFDGCFGHELGAWWVVSSNNEVYLYTRSYLPGDNRKLMVYRVGNNEGQQL